MVPREKQRECIIPQRVGLLCYMPSSSAQSTRQHVLWDNERPPHSESCMVTLKSVNNSCNENILGTSILRSY